MVLYEQTRYFLGPNDKPKMLSVDPHHPSVFPVTPVTMEPYEVIQKVKVLKLYSPDLVELEEIDQQDGTSVKQRFFKDEINGATIRVQPYPAEYLLGIRDRKIFWTANKLEVLQPRHVNVWTRIKRHLRRK